VGAARTRTRTNPPHDRDEYGTFQYIFLSYLYRLNEGFATYIEYKGVQSYETDWDMESRFLTSDLHRVLELDATFGSHPIVVDVDTPDQINAVFDTISYSKGASVIRMMESFLGKEDFRKGISNFLTKYSYGNAVTEDLLRELTAVSTEGLNVTSIMDTWTRQKGFPVLTLTKIKNVYSIQQERFLADIGAYTDTTDVPSPFNYKWEIPVSYITSAQPKSPTQKWFHIDDDVLDV
jgi:glutamyl aminopeptidase